MILKLIGMGDQDADEYAKPPLPDGVIRHARKSRVINSFVRNVWSQRMRCFPCHTQHEMTVVAGFSRLRL